MKLVVLKQLSKEEQLVFKIAGLLHDLGHGPFSHTFEKILKLKQINPTYYHHEFYTCAIISDPTTEINQVLKKYQIDVQKITNIIKKDQSQCPKYQIQLVSSQLDCDRIDYLMRDGYFTGVAYGAIDLDWVISNMIIDSQQGILFSYKALSAIENYLITRFHMYLQIYFHKSSIFFDLKIQKLFIRISQLNQTNYQWKINLTKIKPILTTQVISIEQYLALTDATLINLLHDIVTYESDETLLLWAKAILYHQEHYQIVFTSEAKPQSGELKNAIYDLKKDPIMIKLADNQVLPLEKISQLFENPTKKQKLFYFLEKNN